MLVVDASAVAVAFLSSSDAGGQLRQRLRAEDCHAPHLIDAETGHLVRRRVLRGALDAAAAEEILHDAVSVIDHRYEMTGPLARAAWALRDNVSYYDALYVALAAALDVPLITADERLRRAPGLPCATESAVDPA